MNPLQEASARKVMVLGEAARNGRCFGSYTCKAVIALSLTSALTMLTIGGGICPFPVTRKRCWKCLVGQPCFPSASELAAFNVSIGDRLFAEQPIGAVYYAKD
jgi:hypothetical protein